MDSKKLKIPRSTVGDFLKNQTYGKKKGSGRPRVLTERQNREIRREATNSSKSHRSIQELAPNASASTVLRVIKSSPNLVRRKAKRCPKLTKVHKTARLAFAMERHTWTREWLSVGLSDFRFTLFFSNR